MKWKYRSIYLGLSVFLSLNYQCFANKFIDNTSLLSPSKLADTTLLPNIILIMSDDQGWGDVGYQGHPYLKTPNLDKMAANGVVFSRFYAGSAVCSPTRGSVLTGRHPMRYGICYANCGHLNREEVTIAELVKEKGYATGHFGKWHLGTLTRDEIDANRGGRPENDEHFSPPWLHGYDTCFVTESKVPTWNPMITPSASAGDVGSRLTEGQPFGTAYWTGPGQKAEGNLEGDDSRVIMDRTIEFIGNSINVQSPFLAVVWFHTPHLPVLTGEKYRSIYSDLSEDQQHYYGSITAMDEQIGRLRDYLKSRGISDNTIISFTSDNGPEGKSVSGRTQGITNGLRGRKRSLYEGGIRVPGILEWPNKIDGGITIDQPCSTSDYFVTIAHILDIDIEKYQRPFDGQTWLPFLEESGQEYVKGPIYFWLRDQVAIVDQRYKIYSEDGGQSFKLYDITDLDGEEDELNLDIEKQNRILKWKACHQSVLNSSQGGDY
ncbi:sulfatase family protein [Membranihabitans marinus]|uniref:sulfatase family protein n=1 Tax=Membranihabitans marinus TaxID=1227546 RepID=UPI001F0069F8|nr:sulfatase-like hydrolase/transferase [Membranihabitans marinus]